MFKTLSFVLVYFSFFCSIIQANDFELSKDLNCSFPNAERSKDYIKYLSVSLKIVCANQDGSYGTGSGTIIYYDANKKLAYVASCGHLWNSGVFPVGKCKEMDCSVIAFYQNDKKLESPKKYPAKVIFYSNVRGQDTSLLTFSPDWVPKYMPIAPIDYELKKGKEYNSLGCDAGSEVARYKVIYMYKNDYKDLITQENSPRPGRSGGGLFDEKFYIGTCWGTSHEDGSGEGLFTSLEIIHNFWEKQKDYKFLLNIKKLSSLKIIDRNNSQKSYEENYIFSPSN
ncbi:MAG: hypothetical protein EKK64_03265 [Neisseriaceae bacterium]|nr:MAG: hypothetical protein EKK64_03265 [Neisseriaceae bacterium]